MSLDPKPLLGAHYDVMDAHADVSRALYAMFGTAPFTTADVEKIGTNPNMGSITTGSGAAALARVLHHLAYSRRDLFSRGNIAYLLDRTSRFGWIPLSPTERVSLARMKEGWRIRLADYRLDARGFIALRERGVEHTGTRYFAITALFTSRSGDSASGNYTYLTEDADGAEELLESFKRDERARIVLCEEVWR